ncbi:MAG: NAD-dependent succinate-semialdehyde dehydrogenase [Sphingobacterium sp.]
MENSLFKENAFLNGEFIESSKKFPVINPATGTTLGQVPDLSTVDCRQFIIAAHTAWQTWKSTAVIERTKILIKLHQLIEEHRDELAEIMTLESGKPIQESRAEVTYGNSFIEWFAEEAKRAYGETLPAIDGQSRIQTIKQSVGPVAAITPWNFPLAMVTRKIAPALAAGCSVVLKPASQTPFTAIALAKLCQKAGLPAGVFNVLTSKDSQGIGQELATSNKIRKISFTGSTEVGRTLMEQSASTIKRVSLELGGNAPFIVFEKADIEQAVAGAIAGKFRNTGQTCVAINRFYIQESIYTEFTEKLTTAVRKLIVGPGINFDSQVGPLVNQAGLQKVEHHVQDARNKGAKLETGGHRIKGLFYKPTVLSNVPQEALIASEETFGPVCALFKFETEQEAIERANSTPFGLASYFYSQDIHQCLRVSEQLEAGMVGINSGMISNASAPFGGIKQSGLGREGSKYGLDEYLEVKYLNFGL